MFGLQRVSRSSFAILAIVALVGAAMVVASAQAGRQAAQASVTVLSPKAGSSIAGTTVVLRLRTSGFRITDQATTIRRGEGHFHVFLDKRPFVAVYGLKFVFRGQKAGAHVLRVEPVNSGHMPAAGLKPITVRFRTT